MFPIPVVGDWPPGQQRDKVDSGCIILLILCEAQQNHQNKTKQTKQTKTKNPPK